MAKKSKSTKSKSTVKCQCSRCEQVAFAQEGTVHYYCQGIDPKILAMLPPALKGITNPTRKGTWKIYVAPLKEVLTDGATGSTSEEAKTDIQENAA